MSHFYTRYIKIEAVIEELHSLDLNDKELVHLTQLLDSSLHHAILNEVLSHLNEVDKKQFVHLLSKQETEEKILEFLQSRIESIDQKIEKVAEDLVSQMHKDVKETKRMVPKKR